MPLSRNSGCKGTCFVLIDKEFIQYYLVEAVYLLVKLLHIPIKKAAYTLLKRICSFFKQFTGKESINKQRWDTLPLSYLRVCVLVL